MLLKFCFAGLFLAALLAGCAGVGVEEEKEAEFHLKMGSSSLNEGNVQGAFVELQKSMQLNPNNKETLNTLGLVYIHLDDFNKAKDLFIRAISLDAEFSEAHNNLGLAYAKSQEWEKAIDSYKKALLNPLFQTPEKAFGNLGTAYYRSGQYDLAANAFKDAIRRNQQFVQAYYGLALYYNKASRYGDAANALKQALQVDPEYGGNANKYAEETRRRLLSAKGDEEQDLKDLLEILNY